MNITKEQLESELEAFGHQRIEIVAELAHNGPPDHIGPALMLAIGSRESHLRNIVGDHGHGRGWLQIDDRFHPGFLSTHRGCESGSFKAKFASALPKDRVPTLTAATLFAVQLLRDNMQFARQHGVPKQQVLRFAVAAYNAGAGGALAGHQAGDVDRKTAAPTRDYSADVLARAAVVGGFLKRNGLST
jgi:hypothetical protein